MTDVAENMLQGDYSQMYSLPSYDEGWANFQSHWLGELLSGTKDRDLRDFSLSEQSAVNSFVRDMQKLYEQNVFNHNEAELNRQFQSLEAQKERDWSEHMRNTAYQATMADMRDAGLNPILAFSQGASSAPSGASASGSSASSGSGSSSSGRGFSSSSTLAAVASILAGTARLLAGSYGINKK